MKVLICVSDEFPLSREQVKTFIVIPPLYENLGLCVG